MHGKTASDILCMLVRSQNKDEAEGATLSAPLMFGNSKFQLEHMEKNKPAECHFQATVNDCSEEFL